MAATLFDKLWNTHRVASMDDGYDLIAIDRTFLHERTGGVALQSLAAAGREAFAPERVFAFMDHIVSFDPQRERDQARMEGGEEFIVKTRAMTEAAAIKLFDTDDPRQGIVHVVAPELGLVLPGLTIVCPDSHTCSLGAMGALAWGVGSSEAEHAVATGVVRVKKPQQMRIKIDGALNAGVTAKDIALHIIAHYGAGGGQQRAIEYCGSTIDQLTLEGRLTLCNMAVEFAAFTAVIAPDEKVFTAIKGQPHAPSDDHWHQAMEQWRQLKTDSDAAFDHEICIEATEINPMITWGTNPEQATAIDGFVPQAADQRSLNYMDLKAGQAISELAVDGAFIGSCTNGRLSDLRAAARVLENQRVAAGVRAVCVPGSKAVKAAAEQEGLDRIFRSAGFLWGSPGCAMCFYAGGETFAPGARVISSTNRNFQGRQGPGVRTHLANPEVVAASAIAGKLSSPAQLHSARQHTAQPSNQAKLEPCPHP